ncbi:sugar transporter [Lampropedia aestuarii]|uniref:Sugar transporter n=1 Tax=Lampropedia aestuarii TaxID=2562762 RepID=A0A4S5BPE1_9BURK|nr:sugar transporter [Lampropedia aestuarii]MDH5858322.1 sugar transporter [Lampropedia aestuarii]THJ31466.1 sugar transporter [Lampropedia aestuarii]
MQVESSPSSSVNPWWGVIALALSAFIFNTTEFVPIGLLSDIGRSFDMRTEHVGLMLTIYAWAVALASLPLMLVTREVERRKLLTWLFALFIASHVVCALAPNFYVLLAGRLGIAAAHAIFWSITASLVVRIAPAGRKGQALGMLATGTSMAMVLGIPLGRMVGALMGWRWTFALIGVIALVVMLLLMRLLPRLPSKNSGDLSSLPILLKRPALVSIYALIIVSVTAHFTAYSYMEPFMEHVALLSPQFVTWILLLFGGAGLLGSALFSWQGLKRPDAFLLATFGALALCLLGLQPSAPHIFVLLPLIVLWGMVFLCLVLVMQARVLGLASDSTDVAMSLFSGLFNVGIGAGALLGSQVGIHMGVAEVGYVGGVIAIVGLIGAALALQRYKAVFATQKIET